MIKENLKTSHELEKGILKRIENLRSQDRELEDKTDEMERYLAELRIEQNEILDKMRVLKQKEDELYVLMALNGEIPDKKALQRIKELTDLYYRQNSGKKRNSSIITLETKSSGFSKRE